MTRGSAGLLASTMSLLLLLLRAGRLAHRGWQSHSRQDTIVFKTATIAKVTISTCVLATVWDVCQLDVLIAAGVAKLTVPAEETKAISALPLARTAAMPRQRRDESALDDQCISTLGNNLC